MPAKAVVLTTADVREAILNYVMAKRLLPLQVGDPVNVALAADQRPGEVATFTATVTMGHL